MKKKEKSDCGKLKTYKVFTLVEALGKQQAREAIEKMGVSVCEVKLVKKKRTLNQNSALHLWFTQIADEAINKGLTMDMLIKKPTILPITEGLLKDFFRFIGKKLYGRDSTADLEKDEFNVIQQTFDRAVIERLDIDIPFPSILTMEDELDKS